MVFFRIMTTVLIALDLSIVVQIKSVITFGQSLIVVGGTQKTTLIVSKKSKLQ